MGQPRFVPITVTVDGVAKGVAEVKGLTNAFDNLDKTTNKASAGLKNAFENNSLGSSLNGFGKNVSSVDAELAKMHSDAQALLPALTGVETGAVGAGAGVAGMLGPIAALVAAIPIVVALLSSAAFGAVQLSKHAAEAGNKVYEVQQQTKLLPETISAISVAAKLSGPDVGNLSGALTTFAKNVAVAKDSDNKFSKQLRDSNIDITNTETALRGVFRALATMPAGQRQVELANNAFGASSEAVMAVIKETNGDIDTAIAKYGSLGLILSGDATRAAHNFERQLTTLDLQIDAVKVRVGQQFMPVVLNVIQQVSNYLQRNSGEWVRWASDVVEGVKDVKAALDDYASFALTVTGLGGLNSDFADLLSLLKQIGSAATGLGAVMDIVRSYGALRRPVDPNAIPQNFGSTGGEYNYPGTMVGTQISPRSLITEEPSLQVQLRESRNTSEQLEKDAKALLPFQQRAEAAGAALQTFGLSSHFAAEMQYQLKHPVNELSVDLQDAATKYYAVAAAQAKQLDGLEATKKANDEAIKQAERQTQAQESFRNEIDAVILRTKQLGDVEGATRTELEKFNESLIKRKDQKLLDPKAIDDARAAYGKLDAQLERLANNKAFDKLEKERQQVINSLQSIRENVDQSGAGAIPDAEQRLIQRHAVLQRTAKSIEGIANLKIDRTKFAGLVDLFKAAPDAIDMGKALELLRSQLDPKVLENISPKDIAQVIDILKQASGVDRDLAAAQSELGQAQRQIGEDFKFLESEVTVAAATAADRYRNVKLAAINDVALASDRAIQREIQNQVYLAHQMDVDFNRLNDGVVDFLAHQKTLQETFQDVRTNTVRAFFDGIDSAIDKMTKRLGVAGDVLGSFLKDLAHLAASQLLQRLLGIGNQGQLSGPASSGGGIFSTINAAGSVFNPSSSGNGVTNSSSASASAVGNIFSRLNPFGGSSISAPPVVTGSGATWGNIGGAIGFPGAPGAAASSGGLRGLLGAAARGLGAIAPLLGVGLGASLGGGSTLGTILGGIGGGLLGLGVAGAFGALPVALAGLAIPGAIFAAPLIIGAILLARNAARRRDEKTRDVISNNTGTEIWKLIDEARSLGTSASLARWNEIASNYQTQIAQIKDGKTKRNAQLQWTNDFLPLLDIVKQRAKEGDAAKAASSAFVPTFAGGSDLSGLVPYRGGMQTLIKVRPGERVDDVGMMRSWHVPGIDYGRDSVYTMATPGSAVRTRSQQARIPGFAGGSNATIGGDGGTVVVESMTVQLHMDAEGLVRAGLKSDGARKIIAKQLSVEINKEGRAGVLGDIETALTKRT